MIDQLTVCLPDGPGKLAAMCHLLGEESIQIHALMVAETVDFGIIRVICDKPRATAQMLRERGYNAMCARVVAAEVENVPGALGTSSIVSRRVTSTSNTPTLAPWATARWT